MNDGRKPWKEFVLRAFLEDALERNGGNVSKLARELGEDRSNLRRTMRSLGMPRRVVCKACGGARCDACRRVGYVESAGDEQ